MISPPELGGVAFTGSEDGDVRNDSGARHEVSRRLGIPSEWATLTQVHGTRVVEVRAAGNHGEADALWTVLPGLPIAVFTADCFGVVAMSPSAVGVAHAGWRGAEAGVVHQLLGTMASAGHEATRVVVGPGIGPCCFEVGPEVVDRFPGQAGLTSWGTPSVDLMQRIRSQVPGDAEVVVVGGCTKHDSGWFSHRETGTKERMAALAWI